MKRQFPLALILAACLATISTGQQPVMQLPTKPPAPQQSATQSQKPAEEEVVRITTNLVQVDAIVTDKNGKPVTDLKPEEVQVLEDGKAQKITHFSYIVAETPEAARQAVPATVDQNAPPVPPAAVKPEQVRRTIALVVDDLGLSFESTYYVRHALKKFVDEQMQPGDLVAIIRTGGGIGALQQFTSDKRQLYAAIERVRWRALGRGGIGAFAPMEPATPGKFPTYTNSVNDKGNQGKPSTTNSRNFGANVDAANEELNQFREDLFAVGTLGAVNYVVKGMRELPGRKSILLISDGFRIYSYDDPTRNYRTLERLKRLIDEAGRASVVIYTMNATGLQTLTLTAADDTSGRTPEQLEEQLSNRPTAAFESQEGLDYLAKETGGIAIRNTNDLGRGIRRVLEDQKGYYLIGYRPDESTFDPETGRRTFHKLSVKVLRPGKFNVRMRKGFFGITDEEAWPAPLTRERQLVGALISPFGSSGVHLQLTSLFANDARAGSIMRSFLYVDAGDLTFTDEPDGAHKCVFDIVAITFGDNGVAVDQFDRTYTMRTSGEAYQRALRDGLVWNVTVPIKKSGAYQLRVAFRDVATEHVGSASQFVEVPDVKKNRLALSSVVVDGIDAAKFKRNNAEGVQEDEPQASVAVRHFRPGMVMQYGFAIYNAQLDKASGKPQLITQVRIFRDGKAVFTGKETPFEVGEATDLKRLLASGALQLGTDMLPGEYVLQVIVTDTLASEKHRRATQWMDFEVVK